MFKLNQVLAVEKSIKNRTAGELDTLYKVIQKPALFDGFSKTYAPKADDGEKIPPQMQRVQMKSEDIIKSIGKNLEDLFDVTAQKDFANCNATADVIVDEVTLLNNVPTTFLLFLEKQLTDLATCLGKLPLLDPAKEWQWDVNSSLFRSDTVQSIRTAKKQKALVLYPHSDKHPAQTQLITEDEAVGTWDETKLSGAVTESRRKLLVERIEKLHKAVKVAREKANMADAAPNTAGQKLMAWLFKS